MEPLKAEIFFLFMVRSALTDICTIPRALSVARLSCQSCRSLHEPKLFLSTWVRCFYRFPILPDPSILHWRSGDKTSSRPSIFFDCPIAILIARIFFRPPVFDYVYGLPQVKSVTDLPFFPNQFRFKIELFVTAEGLFTCREVGVSGHRLLLSAHDKSWNEEGVSLLP